MKTNFSKKSHNAEKTERGALWDFSTSILSQNIKKLKGDPLVDFFSKQSLTMPKKTERGPLVSSGVVLRGKRKNPFGSVRYAK